MKTHYGTGSAKFAWQAEYAESSVSQSSFPEGIKYIERQAEHYLHRWF